MEESTESLLDCGSYDVIWNTLILPTVKDYEDQFAEISLAYNAKHVIWEEYVKFNKRSKESYMQNPSGKLDRHKVCACYMFAILKANVLSCGLAGSNMEESYLLLNENLAITVGMSLLRAFILASIDSNNSFTLEDKSTLKAKLEEGIVFPECNHGSYRNNFLSELHYTNEERNYNILSLANTLFLLEIHTLQVDVVHRHQHKEKK